MLYEEKQKKRLAGSEEVKVAIPKKKMNQWVYDGFMTTQKFRSRF
jgi:hypothetical protein